MSHDRNQLHQAVLSAMSEIKEPGGKNLAELALLLGMEVDGGDLQLKLRNPNWPEPILARITREIQQRLAPMLSGISEIQIAWGSEAGAGVEAQEPDFKHVIAVGSGKGGVGKSTIAASLAYALKLKGYRVGLMDADVYGPSIPHLMGLEGRPAVANNRYQPLVMDDIACISMGFLVPPNQAVVWRGPMLHKAVRDFLYSVEWGKRDFLVVDLPPGTGDVVLSLSQQMPITGGVIVCTPQDVALLDARKAFNMLGTVKIPCLGVVENMSFFLCPKCQERTEIFGHGGAQRWASEIGAPFLGAVPINLSIRQNGDAGHIRDNFAANNPVREVLMGIADNLLSVIAKNEINQAPTLEIV